MVANRPPPARLARYAPLMGASAARWVPDIVTGFEQASIAGVTLVRPLRQPDRPRSAVLHVHGYNDYFFQDHLARAFTDAGHAFYAVDLARAGRSLRPGDTPVSYTHLTLPTIYSV